MKTHSLILMKNIHVIATDKPSRLYYNTKGKCYAFSNKILSQGGWVENQNIYITSETEAKRIRDYVYDELSKKVVKITNDNEVVTASQKGYFKVILTTDTELIADGVQTIDDDFLEWFVKNPSCEFVEVKANFNHPRGVFGYQTIIPKEEQKQNLIDMMQDDEKLGLYDKPKQTAVEWLLDNLISEPYSEEDFEHNKECWIKAEEMEKQQIIEAFWNGDNTDCLSEQNAKEFAEQYYNETFKNE